MNIPAHDSSIVDFGGLLVDVLWKKQATHSPEKAPFASRSSTPLRTSQKLDSKMLLSIYLNTHGVDF